MTSLFSLPEFDPCPFCERIEGRDPAWAPISEGPLAVAFVNARQFEVGQALVVPRRHAPTILDMTDDELAQVMRTARHVARAMVAAFAPDGLTLYQNNGTVSLQEVPHFHLHVVPRRLGGGWGEGPPHLRHFDRADLLATNAHVVASHEDQVSTAALIRSHLPD